MATVSETIRKRAIASSQDGQGFSYSDDTRTWTLSNITEGTFDKVVYTNAGVAVCRALDGSSIQGLVYSEDGGATWSQSNIDEGYFTSIIKLRNGLLYTSSVDTGKTYSSEDGKTWEVASQLLKEYLFSQWEDELNWEATLAANRDSGRNLATVFGISSLSDLAQFLRDKGNARDYSGILPCGDYIELPSISFGGTTYTNTGNGSLRFVVAGLGTYDGVGDTDSGPGILFLEKNVLCQSRMEASNTNSNKFPATELGLKYSAAVAGIESTLGVSLRTVHRYYDESWAAEKLFVPTEVEVFGAPHWSVGDFNSKYSTSIIWPLFSRCPQTRIKFHQTNTSERRWWWTATKSSTSGCYTSVGNAGGADHYIASNTNLSAVLGFYL